MADELPPRRPPSWTVVHKPRIAVRAEPAVSAALRATKITGAVVEGEQAGGWVKLADGAGFILIDGAAAGVDGPLLQRNPIPDGAIVLEFVHPSTGKGMLHLEVPHAATIKAVKRAVAEATGLRAGAMVLARAAMGSRISDSAANLFDDEETVWECGFVEGQKVGYMYLGEAEADLNEPAKAGGLRARCESVR